VEIVSLVAVQLSNVVSLLVVFHADDALCGVLLLNVLEVTLLQAGQSTKIRQPVDYFGVPIASVKHCTSKYAAQTTSYKSETNEDQVAKGDQDNHEDPDVSEVRILAPESVI
jgi:hypothetical protein